MWILITIGAFAVLFALMWGAYVLAAGRDKPPDDED
jgi:hypothetical protein